MVKIGCKAILSLLVIALAATLDGARADGDQNEKETGWFDSTEFSMVVTEGNSETETIGFKNTLQRRWEASRFRVKLDVVKSDTADDRYAVLEPGLTWLPGEGVPDGATSVVEPGAEPDVERYFAEAKYERNITDRFFWNVGGSWDRDEDAGILNRYIGFGGLGQIWKNKKGLEFSTSYGLSFTDREEDEPDPEKDDNFAGVRVGWDYLNAFGKAAVYENDFTANMSVKDTADYTLNMTNAIGVSLTDRLALKISLQWLYNAEPALEEVDVVALVVLNDPDGTPGTGDEFYETVASSGNEFEIGDTKIRKDELDTTFRTSLVISF